MERSTTFDGWIRDVIAHRGISARQLAAYAGVSANAVHGWARGAQPKPENLAKLARALNEDYVHLARLAGVYTGEDPREGEGAVVYVPPEDAAWFREVSEMMRDREFAGLVRPAVDALLRTVLRVYSTTSKEPPNQQPGEKGNQMSQENQGSV